MTFLKSHKVEDNNGKTKQAQNFNTENKFHEYSTVYQHNTFSYLNNSFTFKKAKIKPVAHLSGVHHIGHNVWPSACVCIFSSQSALKHQTCKEESSGKVRFGTFYAHFAHRGKELQYGLSIKDTEKTKKK